MAQIDVDEEAVRKAARDLRSCTAKLKEKARTFDDIEEEIENAWKSQYTSRYLNCLESTESGVSKTIRSIDTIAANLEKIADAVEITEQEVRQSMAFGGGGNGGGGFRGSGGGGGGSW
jgi:uncharacterized protein YukE